MRQGFPSCTDFHLHRACFHLSSPRLSDRYHLVAPDYPGFGHSDWPDPKQFAYTFDHCAEIMNHFTEALGLSRYTLYMQDYGAPVGFRMALAHPDRVEALIIQDAVAHNEGLGANWATRRAFWADRPAYEEALRKNLLSLATTKTRHLGNDPNIELYDPDLWSDEYAFLNAPGQAQIQSDLFHDYRTNVDAYPKGQAWMREKQPRLLVIWGKHDLSFDLGEPERYRKDVPSAEVHVLDAGHFALDTKAEDIAALVRESCKSRSRWELRNRKPKWLKETNQWQVQRQQLALLCLRSRARARSRRYASPKMAGTLGIRGKLLWPTRSTHAGGTARSSSTDETKSSHSYPASGPGSWTTGSSRNSGRSPEIASQCASPTSGKTTPATGIAPMAMRTGSSMTMA
jgi:pimeloyl-ACP methyl ester carboxylesterase